MADDVCMEWPDGDAKETLVKVTVRLTAAQIQKANLIGNANMSAGVRRMVDMLPIDTTFMNVNNAGWYNAFTGAHEHETIH